MKLEKIQKIVESVIREEVGTNKLPLRESALSSEEWESIYKKYWKLFDQFDKSRDALEELRISSLYDFELDADRMVAINKYFEIADENIFHAVELMALFLRKK